jgi:MSHA biogenesis protein MshJ
MIRARVATWLARRSLRERLLAAASALVLVGLAFETSVGAPQRAKDRALRAQIKAQEQAIADLQLQAERQSAQNDQLLRERIEALAARRSHAEQVIRDAQVDLIAPQDMGRQLQALLARHPDLRVVAMNTQPPTLLGDAPSRAGAVAPAANATNATATPATPAPASATPRTAIGLYQHGIEVTVEGRYLDLLSWLQALEKAPYRIYWRELDMQVNSNGVPVTRIALFTLSREAVWMRL